MKRLSEMTTAELITLKEEVKEMIRRLNEVGCPSWDLVNFRNAISNELSLMDRRGA